MTRLNEGVLAERVSCVAKEPEKRKLACRLTFPSAQTEHRQAIRFGRRTHHVARAKPLR